VTYLPAHSQERSYEQRPPYHQQPAWQRVYSSQISHGVIDELQQADPQARVMRQRRALAAAA
jgi:hypothetical protein